MFQDLHVCPEFKSSVTSLSDVKEAASYTSKANKSFSLLLEAGGPLLKRCCFSLQWRKARHSLVSSVLRLSFPLSSQPLHCTTIIVSVMCITWLLTVWCDYWMRESYITITLDFWNCVRITIGFLVISLTKVLLVQLLCLVEQLTLIRVLMVPDFVTFTFSLFSWEHSKL